MDPCNIPVPPLPVSCLPVVAPTLVPLCRVVASAKASSVVIERQSPVPTPTEVSSLALTVPGSVRSEASASIDSEFPIPVLEKAAAASTGVTSLGARVASALQEDAQTGVEACLQVATAAEEAADHVLVAAERQSPLSQLAEALRTTAGAVRAVTERLSLAVEDDVRETAGFVWETTQRSGSKKVSSAEPSCDDGAEPALARAHRLSSLTAANLQDRLPSKRRRLS